MVADKELSEIEELADFMLGYNDEEVVALAEMTKRMVEALREEREDHAKVRQERIELLQSAKGHNGSLETLQSQLEGLRRVHEEQVAKLKAQGQAMKNRLDAHDTAHNEMLAKLQQTISEQNETIKRLGG